VAGHGKQSFERRRTEAELQYQCKNFLSAALRQ
jgi:hypothetical protein